MDFPTNLSSPARYPAFEACSSPHGGQDLSLGRPLDEANGNPNTQYAAGGVHSFPLSPTCPPSVPFTPFDQLRALLSTCFSTDVNAGRGFGLPNSGSSFNTSSQSSELSSSSSSVVSPTSDELSLFIASPDFPFHDLSTNDQDEAASMQACQYPPAQSFSPNDQSYSTPSMQHFFQPVPLPEELSTPEVPIITDQTVGIDITGAFPGSHSSFAVPSFSETMALGLYYPNTPQSFRIPPLSIQVDPSTHSALAPPFPPAATREVRAAAPIVQESFVHSGKKRRATSTSAASGTDEERVLKCPICGFPQSTQRKGDFQRHMRTHGDTKLTRYVCCGVPVAHPAATGLKTGHSVRLYKGCEFHGGCGKSYSRMDALQRHLGKSGCTGGSAKDHQTWRQLYL